MKSDNKIVVIDCQIAGISGDMMLGALIDLGANLTKIKEALNIANRNFPDCSKAHLRVDDVLRREIKAKVINFDFEEPAIERKGKELIKAMEDTVEESDFSSKTKEFAINSITTLVNAEADIHGEEASEVHLAETGSFDTIADIVCVAAAIEDLSLFRNSTIFSLPVAVGGGLLEYSHGTMSIPPPATLSITQSKKIPIIGGPVAFELATPTGVSILANIVGSYTRFSPLMKPSKTGYGAGQRDFSEIPNVMRITIGESCQSDDRKIVNEEVFILETNVDDVTGEVISYTVDKLLNEGAKDVVMIPVFMKKNRPGHIIRLMTDNEKIEHLAEVMFRELGTIGVRVFPLRRYVLHRDVNLLKIRLGGNEEKIRVKTSKDSNGKVINLKPEYEDVKQLAQKMDTPLREILEIVKSKLRQKQSRT